MTAIQSESIAEHVQLITLNRPDALNALTADMLDELVAALSAASESESVRCIVITGAGKAFCAGVDLKELGAGGRIFDNDGLGPKAAFVAAMRKCPKPIVGAINGAAVTGGFELALACDFLYASEHAKFADTHARVGIMPGWGLSQKLPRIVGIQRAREISFSGNFFGAEDALRWGLVNRVLAKDELLTAAIDIASQIATALPDALYRVKAIINDGWEMSLGDALIEEGRRSQAYMDQIDVDKMEERLEQLKARSRK